MTWLTAFLHHLAAFTLVGGIATQFVLTRLPLTVRTGRALLAADQAVGAAAAFLLVVGLLRVFFFEKGAAYYLHSAPFIAKFSVFVILALLSIQPTRAFLSMRAAVSAGRDPSSIRCG